MVHTNKHIFPSPEKFIPQRWLDDKTLEKQRLVAWSRGTRICLGMKFVTTVKLIRGVMTNV